MGCVVKISTRDKGKGRANSSGEAGIVAFPGMNIRQIEKMLKHLQWRDRENGRRK